jgi:uncharacterized protein
MHRPWHGSARPPEQGFASAQYNVGVAYVKGQGVAQDYAQAVAWFRSAADLGSARAQTNLGVAYEYGSGVPQDHVQAVAWYRKAADQGLATAQYYLGGMYENGQGVPQDHVQAVAWFCLAAARAPDAASRSNAVESRDRVAAKMTPAQIAEAQRLASEWVSKK